jgi:hypothetical protein
MVEAGSVTKGTFTITNDGSESVRVKVEPEDWFKARLGRSGIPLDKWFSISPVEFDIEPLGVVNVEYAIAPPSDAKGEFAVMVYFGTTSTQGGLTITSRNGSSIYAAITGAFNLACNIKNVWIEGSKAKGAVFTIEVKNTGDVHLRPTGNIVITAEDGTAYNILIQRGFPAYPGSAEKCVAKWSKTDIPTGRYEAVINLDYGNIYKMEKVLEKKIVFIVNKDGSISY